MATIYHDYNRVYACLLGMQGFKQRIAKQGYNREVRNYDGQKLEVREIHIFRANSGGMQEYGRYNLYLYSYPQVQKQKKVVYKNAFGHSNRYYDEGLEEKLGGKKEVL